MLGGVNAKVKVLDTKNTVVFYSLKVIVIVVEKVGGT